MDFLSTHVFSVKKQITAQILQLVGFSVARHIITLQRQEQTLGDQSCDGLQGNESCDATTHAQAPPPPLH
jgi:hypothetical protein